MDYYHDRPLKDALGIVGVIGVIAAALSAFRIVTDVFDGGLNAFWHFVVLYWDGFVEGQLLKNISKVLGVEIPLWAKKPIIFWIICWGLAVRTLKSARNYSLATDPYRKELGIIEYWLFNMPNWQFYIISSVVCFIALPLVILRLIYSKPLFYIEKTRRFTIGMTFIRYPYNYRTVIFVQSIIFTLAFLIMLITNGGL